MIDGHKPVISRLLLDTKADIPFPAAQVTIHQPSIYEISLLGNEINFIIGVKALTKNYKAFEDNSDLSQLSNFEILMTMIMQKTEDVQKIRKSIEDIFLLLFPYHKAVFTPRSIILQSLNEDKQISMIDANIFNEFTDIIFDMFCLQELQGEQETEYNPAGDRARALVEKFKAKREFLAQRDKERGHDSSLMTLFGKYIDILAAGEKKDKNVLSQYSVYQLVEEFKRFQLKEAFDYTYKAKLAGATKIKDPKDWMIDVFDIEDEDDENN